MTSSKKTVYIAGPMTGIEGFNRDSFNLAELALKKLGHEVRNPACLPCDWSNYEDYIAVGLVMLDQCDTIVFLPGSEKSTGAAIEGKRAGQAGINHEPELLGKVWGLLCDMHRAHA